MLRTMRALLLAPALLIPTCGAGGAPPRTAGLSRGAAAALDGRLEAAARSGEIPAVVVLVTDADRVVYAHAAGRLHAAADVPLRVDSIFRIASMTKPLTSAAIMQLVEAGRLRLDDPASMYVPAIGQMRVAVNIRPDGSYDTRPPARPITVRDLLTHTSGIGYSWSDPLLFRLQRAGRSEAELPLLHDPGEKWTYGASTKYLGDIVEKATGQPIDVFLKARLFDPLGMADTGFEVPAASRSRVVTLHQRERGQLVERENPPVLRSPVRGDGGLFSTAGDYARFLRLLLNGGRAGSARLLAESSVREMTRNQIGRLFVREQPVADAARAHPFPLGAGRDTWGLGFQIAGPPSRPHERSAGSYGWAGINNTFFWVDPVRRIGVIVLMQQLPFYDEAAITLLTDVEALVSG